MTMNTKNMDIASNRVRDIERYFYEKLVPQYPREEVRQFFLLLCDSFLGWNSATCLLRRDETVNQSDLLKFYWAVQDLMQWRPIQHITGYTEFCDCVIKVSPEVLIPRPETEEMIHHIVDFFSSRGREELKILDCCTGSGCIAIALGKYFPNAQITALDISESALAVAQQNARQNGVKVHFMQADVLQAESLQVEGPFDLIVSNPPYIREQERGEMRENVLNYEPSTALFVPDADPLIFYRKIGQYAIHHLAPKGLLAFEINENLAMQTATLLTSTGFPTTRILPDFNAKSRMTFSSMPENV